jgi:hypothetical protein
LASSRETCALTVATLVPLLVGAWRILRREVS